MNGTPNADWASEYHSFNKIQPTNYYICRILLRALTVFLSMVCLLSILKVSEWQKTSFAAADSSSQEQGLTVLVLNNAVDVHSPEIGSFYGLSHLLNEMGIPFETANWHTGFNQLDPAIYPLVIINDYIGENETNSSKENALAAYLTCGGVVIAPQIMDAELQALFGVTGYTQDKKKFFIKFVESGDASMRYLNRSEEMTIRLGDPTLYPEIYDFVGTYTTSPTAEVLARAFNGNGLPVGPTIVKHTIGTGKSYILGFSFFGTILRSESNRDPEAQRVFVNGFEPGADVIRLFVRAIYEEAAGGHFVRKHTVPSYHDSALIVTHDVDAQEAYHDNFSTNGWGRAVARQFADLEMNLGVTATYFFTTKYVSDNNSPAYWHPSTVEYICDKGFDCHSHSVRHLRQLSLPVGTCNETFTNYDPLNNPTLCGELKVPKELIEAITGQPVVSFRSPYLSFHPNLPETLHSASYQYDSSFTGPDTLTNYPYVLMENTLFTVETPIVELPVTLDDAEIGFELGPNNVNQVLARWKKAIIANKENNAINVLLIHPSKGHVCQADPNCHTADFKLEAEEKIVEFAKTQNLLVNDLTSFAEFWRMRDNVQIEASYTEGDNNFYRYSIVLTNMNSEAISGLTLDLGDPIFLESHDSTHPVNVIGNRIIFEQIDPDQVVKLIAVRPPTLEITKRASPSLIQDGEQLTYTIQVTNTAGVTLNATVTDILPSHVTPTGVLNWTPITIEPGDVWEKQVIVTVQAGYTGPLINEVQIVTEQGAIGTANVTVCANYCPNYLPIILN